MVSILKNTAELQKTMDDAGNKLILLDFYATWCGPCRAISPYVQKLAKEYKDKVIVLKVNVEKFPEISDYYKVKNMPTFVFIRNKKCLSSFAGADDKMLKEKMRKLVK